MTDITQRLRQDISPLMKEAVCPVYLLLEAADEIDKLRKVLRKLRSYNSDVMAERINYRPFDHILVIDDALETRAMPHPKGRET